MFLGELWLRVIYYSNPFFLSTLFFLEKVPLLLSRLNEVTPEGEQKEFGIYLHELLGPNSISQENPW
jgi:hypothetical protein